MIISHKHRFIFVAIPKTGTHSVRRALRKHLGADDQEQVRLFEEKALPIADLAAIGHGHISLRELRPHVPTEVFDGYFKFAFVRNPFDRFISYCSFMTRNNGAFDQDPQGVMRAFIANPPLQRILFVPQKTFVTDETGTLATDEIGRVEEMQSAYDAICARIGIPTEPLEKANSSRRGDYRAYYTSPDLIEGVARLYSVDLDQFGYTF